jgi:peptidoglycan L-alanyl-D-glutamate endopeptidase CwlK
MPHYSKRSEKRLATCTAKIITVFSLVIRHFDHTIICGHRTEQDQNAAYDAKKSKVKWPFGKHNQWPSQAVDAGPYNPDTKSVDWPDAEVGKVVNDSHPEAGTYIKTLARWYYFAGFVIGAAAALGIKLRCGADWDRDTILTDQKFDDLVHFEEFDDG